MTLHQAEPTVEGGKSNNHHLGKKIKMKKKKGGVVALNDHPLPPPPSSPPRSTNHLSGKRMHQGSSCGCGSATWSRCLLCLAETTPALACGERQHLPPQQKGKEGGASVHPLHLSHPIFFPLFYILVRQWMKIFCPSCLMWIAPVFCFFFMWERLMDVQSVGVSLGVGAVARSWITRRHMQRRGDISPFSAF